MAQKETQIFLSFEAFSELIDADYCIIGFHTINKMNP
jgi:hypothetical protein